jgi:hypothetical protein
MIEKKRQLFLAFLFSAGISAQYHSHITYEQESLHCWTKPLEFFEYFNRRLVGTMRMDAPVSRSSICLLAAGAIMILLLGAFTQFGSPPPAVPVATVVAHEETNQEASVKEPSWPAGLAPELVEIVKLAQSHLGDDVILEYIKNSGQVYAPSEKDLAYLSDLGLSPAVLNALVKHPPSDSVPSAPPATPVQVPSDVAAAQTANATFFYKDLAPYGSWTQVPNYGLCWQPTVETIDPDWRPYVDQGQWLYTDSGWFWQSQYSWGWAPFHYGRWSHQTSLGWVWVPDQVWGPAWVAWRTASLYAGWAPLPPGVGLNESLGLTFNHQPVAAGFDFGLPAGWFTFVSAENFLSPNLASYSASARQSALVYPRSTSVNNYVIANRKVINLGLGVDKIAAATHQPVKEIALAADRTVPREAPQPIMLASVEEPSITPFPAATALLPTGIDLPTSRAPSIGSQGLAATQTRPTPKHHLNHHFSNNAPFASAPFANTGLPRPPLLEANRPMLSPPASSSSKK